MTNGTAYDLLCALLLSDRLCNAMRFALEKYDMTNRTARLEWARDTMREHGLTGWRLVVNNRAKSRAGLCHYTKRTIEVANFILDNASDAMFINTVTHEVAHAVCGYAAAHGPEWQRCHRAMGGDGKRCVSLPDGVKPAARYTGVCPACETRTNAERLGARMKSGAIACSKCCNTHNAGRYDRRYAFTWHKTPALAA